MKSRGKVQAQRKFAQGVVIPPVQATNNNTVERVRKDEVCSVTTFHNNMSATSLLDAISFKNLHLHLQNKDLEPVVRLERIEPRISIGETSNKLLKKTITKSKKPRIPKLLVVKKKMVRLTRSTSNLLKRKRFEADDIDDDMPLKYLRQSTSNNKQSPLQQANNKQSPLQQANNEKIKKYNKQSPLQQANNEKIKQFNKQSPLQQANNEKMKQWKRLPNLSGSGFPASDVTVTESENDNVSSDVSANKQSPLQQANNEKMKQPNKQSPLQQANNEKMKQSNKQSPLQQANNENVKQSAKQKRKSNLEQSLMTRKNNETSLNAKDSKRLPSRRVAEKQKMTQSNLEQSPITRKNNDANRNAKDSKRLPSRRVGTKRSSLRCVSGGKIKKTTKQKIKLKTKVKKSSVVDKDLEHRGKNGRLNAPTADHDFAIRRNYLSYNAEETPSVTLKQKDNMVSLFCPSDMLDISIPNAEDDFKIRSNNALDTGMVVETPSVVLDTSSVNSDDEYAMRLIWPTETPDDVQADIPETSSNVMRSAALEPAILTLLERPTAEQYASTDQCPSLKDATAQDVSNDNRQCSTENTAVEMTRLVETPMDNQSDSVGLSDNEETDINRTILIENLQNNPIPATLTDNLQNNSMDTKLKISDDEETDINRYIFKENLQNNPISATLIDNVQNNPETLQNVGDSSSRNVDTETPPDVSNLYLDILPPTVASFIQIKSTRVPNRDKQLIIARFMSKTATEDGNEFNLVEHDNLLGQLLATLNIPRSSDDGGETSVAHINNNIQINNPKGNNYDNVEDNNTRLNNADNRNTEESVVEINEVNLDSNKATNGNMGVMENADVSVDNNNAAEIIIDLCDKIEDNEKIQNEINQNESLSNESPSEIDLDDEIGQTTSNDNDCIPSSTKRISEGTDPSKRKSKVVYIKGRAKLVEAPVFKPTDAEFHDPVAYFEKIMPTACKYGICKVKAPENFKPKCIITDNIRFNVSNQYIARLYSRWGLASKEMAAIKSHLATQGVPFTRAPLMDGLEIDLPKLYRTVQKHGGVNSVIQKKLWTRIAEEMRIAKGPKTEIRLDSIYVKYLLPYDTLSSREREKIIMSVTKAWHKKNQRIYDRALNPLYRQKQLLGEAEPFGDDIDDDGDMTGALVEAEDCVITGRNMKLSTFAAEVAAERYFPTNRSPPPDQVETEYWRVVLHGTDHVCVYSASVDTGEEGYGFPKNKSDEYAKHPWNLKMISQNNGNVLRSLGSVLGVTVPTLHVGMTFSTSCWHRDPHGLPWIEYMHSGPAKIWYGIPDEQSDRFRHAVEVLCPTSCQNKSIWLPSDIAMIPPHFLLDQGVSLSRVEQSPGEFIIVFPRAYSCSICTGYTQSESVYFATASWLKTVDQVFQELRDSCEPTMFSLEQLLMSVARDSRSPLCVLQAVHLTLSALVECELQQRRELLRLNVPLDATTPAMARRNARNHRRPVGAWNLRDQDECAVCRTTLYLSKVTGLTKKAAVCLQHALQLRALPHNMQREVSLMLFYSDDELHELVSTLQRRFAPRD